jgi:hypothetical protein
MAAKYQPTSTNRKPSLSASVRTGLAALSDAARPETADEILALTWIRRMLAVVESRQRRRHDAGARSNSAPVASHGGGKPTPRRA